MIEALTAHTFEIDDSAAAVAEILAQIDLEKLKSNSLGILTCSTDFLETGTAAAVSEAMPFNVIGCTTAAGATTGELGELILNLMVLTSDDVVFSAGVTESLAEEQEAPIKAAYRKAGEGRSEKPALILAFAPFINTVGGERIVECLNQACGGLPVFGTLAIDTSPDFSLSETFFNGRNSRTALSFALLYGDIHPSFYLAAIPEEKIQKHRGVITKSSGNILKEVNKMPLLKYFRTLGLYSENGSWETLSFPFVVDYNDGTKPVVRSIFTIDENGYAACGGFVPENATIALGSLEHDDVLHTAGEILSKTREKKDGACLLMFACITRYLVLGADTTAEMEKVREITGGGREYQFCYSGGEICPVYTGTGSTVNRFHNCTFIACII